MTLQEAKEQMKSGKKVTHNYYCKNEFMFFNTDTNSFYFEDGCIVDGWYLNYLNTNDSFKDGWEIYNETKI